MPIIFYGTDDPDTVSAIEGFQFLYGLGGDDNLTSTNGVYCEVFGGNGNDTLAFGVTGWGLIDGGAGNDDIFGSNNNTDELHGGSGNDTINGGGGNDRIDGGSGIDQCNGDDGDDRIFGGAAGDFLNGGAGRDVLVGGGGSDVLNGGDQNAFDIFRFTSVKDSLPGANKRDTIVFSPEDFIDLARIDANTSKAGDQKFIFIGNDPFSGKRGELHVTGPGGDAILSGDVNGDRKADFQIHVIDAGVLADNLVL